MALELAMRAHSVRTLCLVLLGLLIAAPSAQAVDPNQVIGGANSKWFSGSLIQQSGLNCSTAILGSGAADAGSSKQMSMLAASLREVGL